MYVKVGVTMEKIMYRETEEIDTSKLIDPEANVTFIAPKEMSEMNSNLFMRSELTKNELIRMLCCLEGELQARDIVIAALRNERIKRFIYAINHKHVELDDPFAALFRDQIVAVGNSVSRTSSTLAAQADIELRASFDGQVQYVCHTVAKQREAQMRIVKILAESLEKNHSMRHELEEEKQKHEHDTAQGDDITYGLEMERTKLKQELETERFARKKLEKDFKKLQETLEFERGRQKQIVLLLLAERKNIILKYVEERKKSEDLAQILSEEKQRSDAIAEGMEQECKKSSKLEAEMEKQTIAFEMERRVLKSNLEKEEKRLKDLEVELKHIKCENESIRKQSCLPRTFPNHSVIHSQQKGRSTQDESTNITLSSAMNVTKIIQPTATVSSVPVTGPTTGIARSVPPGQILGKESIILTDTFSGTTSTLNNALPSKVGPWKIYNQPTGGGNLFPTSISQLTLSTAASTITSSEFLFDPNVASVESCASSFTSPAAIPNTSTLSPAYILSIGTEKIPLLLSSPTATSSAHFLRNSAATSGTDTSPMPIVKPGGMNPSLSSSLNVPTVSAAGGVVAINSNIGIGLVSGRGIPPPIPPNKPIISSKRDPTAARLNIASTSS